MINGRTFPYFLTVALCGISWHASSGHLFAQEASTQGAVGAPQVQSGANDNEGDEAPSRSYQIPEESVVTSFGPSRRVESEPEPAGTLDTNADGVNEYIIVKGDTLWDICASLMGDPFYWPKLWSLNQYIQNPHLIYPGQVLRFYEGSQRQLPRMTIGEEIEIDDSEPDNRVRDTQFLVDEQVVQNSRRSLKLKPEVFLAVERLDMIGKVQHTIKEKRQLAFGDRVFVSFKRKHKPQVGQRLIVVADEGKLKGMNTSARSNLGDVFLRKAELEIIKVGKKLSEAKVLDNEYAFNRGDDIVLGSRQEIMVEPYLGEKSIQGRILRSNQDLLMMSTADLVFIDKGSKQGVKKGMLVRVLDPFDPVIPNRKTLPSWVEKGELIVVEVYENASLTYVLDVIEFELKRGDWVEVRTAEPQ